MRAEVSIDFSDQQRMVDAVQRRKAKICQRIADLAAQNAVQYSEGRTPNVDYESEVEIHGDVVTATLEAVPQSRGADINLRIALGGRKAYFIVPKHGRRSRSGRGPGMLVWPAGERGDPIDGAARRVFKPAIPPVLGGQFIDRALKNAVQRIRNQFR